MTTTLVDAIGWPEGLRWHEGELYYSDVFGRQAVYAASMDGSVRTVADVPIPSGMGWLPDGDLIVVSMSERCLMRIGDDGKVSRYADLSPVARFPNDMTVLADGTAYLGDNGFEFGVETPVESHVVMVPLDGHPEVVATGLGMPNGMEPTPDGSALIVAETLAGRLSALDIRPGGSLGERTTFHAFDDRGFLADIGEVIARGVAPDGICIDADGHVWVGNPLAAEISLVSPEGEVLDRVQLSQPGIAAALGGPDGRTLFVATGVLADQSGTAGRIEYCTVETPAPS